MRTRWQVRRHDVTIQGGEEGNVTGQQGTEEGHSQGAAGHGKVRQGCQGQLRSALSAVGGPEQLNGQSLRLKLQARY